MQIIKRLVYSSIFVAALALIYKFLTIGLVPFKYLLILALLIILAGLLLVFAIKKNHKLVSGLAVFGAILVSTVVFASFSYLNSTYDFIYNMSGNNNEIEVFYLVTIDEQLNDINNIGVFETKINNIQSVLNLVKNKYKVNYINYVNINESLSQLESNTIDALVIDKYNYDLLIESHINLFIHETFSIKITTNYTIDNEILDKPFNLYISGIDTDGDIMTKSRSDVNMLVTIDPNNNEILLTNIPRDYYVNLGTINEMDKITHSGVIGIDESLKTVEQLLDTNIDYYLRVNFNSLASFVDAIEGINVYSEVSFIAEGMNVNYGYNYMNGEEALLYSRIRTIFATGDIQRGENQQQVIEAIINKLTTTSILFDNYEEILESLSNTMQTNMSKDSVISFINYQLDEMPSWQINKYTLTGISSYEKVYSMPGDIYVMLPDNKTVYTAQSKINEIMN